MTEVCEELEMELELAREIQLTDWSTAGEQGKLVFVVSTTPSLAQIISLFTTGKKSSFDRLNYRSIQVFHFKISVKKKRRNEIPIDKQKTFFRSLNQIRRLRVARKPA